MQSKVHSAPGAGPPALIAGLILVLAIAACCQAGPLYEPIAGFEVAPEFPFPTTHCRLLKYDDGNFYGVSGAGGAFKLGTVYRVKPNGELSIVVHFSGVRGSYRGGAPDCGLIKDDEGWLWGTTSSGGNGAQNLFGVGTVFKVHPIRGEFVSVMMFSEIAKGIQPRCTLHDDGTGYMWGTTLWGGASNRGTVFKVNKATGTPTMVAEFSADGGRGGQDPRGSLASDGNGWLWGTTVQGGRGTFPPFGAGTVFKVHTATGRLVTVAEFNHTLGADGAEPMAGLTNDGQGNLWGTTRAGGAFGLGTTFKIRINTGEISTTHHFGNPAEERSLAGPECELVPDGKGSLWGTAPGGSGDGSSGGFFQIPLSSDSPTVSYRVLPWFTEGLSMRMPVAGLTLNEDGSFWGTTVDGDVFRYSDGKARRMTRFQASVDSKMGLNPMGGLIADERGRLWGTTAHGGGDDPELPLGMHAYRGTVFRVDPQTRELATIVQFRGNARPPLGAYPLSTLTVDATGRFWGTTVFGGLRESGLIFSLDPTSGTIEQSYSLLQPSPDGPLAGEQPHAGLLDDGNGFLWGTTTWGGLGLAGGNGTVFKLRMSTGTVIPIVQFTGTSGAALGRRPVAALCPDSRGFLWGTTYEGGDEKAEFGRCGTVFKVHALTGAFTSVAQFTGSDGATRGKSPTGRLMYDGLGHLYGTTSQGGHSDMGTVFKIEAATGALTTIVDFNTWGESMPLSGLVADGRGNLWGTTSGLPNIGLGSIYKLSLDGSLSHVIAFTGSDGAAPGQNPGYGSLLLHSDGHLYGTASGGGVTSRGTPAGGGQIFRLRFGPIPTTQPPASVDTHTATLRGTVHPNGHATSVAFEYSPDPQLSNGNKVSAGIIPAANEVQESFVTLTGLSPDTAYFFRIRAENPENPNAQKGSTLSFRTAAALPGFQDWISTYSLEGDLADANADADLDGVQNAVEYVLGGNPTQPTVTELPECISSPNGEFLHFKFFRFDSSETPDLKLYVETSDTISDWKETFEIGIDAANSSPGVEIEENGGSPDEVKVSIRKEPKTDRFARLRASVTKSKPMQKAGSL